MTPHGSISRLSRLLQALDGWLAAYVRKADFPLTNLFFSSSMLKQRIHMLQKPASSRWKLLRYAAVVPLGAVLWMCTQDAIEPTPGPRLKPYSPGEEVFTVVEQQPEFPGGTGALFRFITETMRYPEPARRAAVEGMVFVTFVITNEGEVRDVQILKGLGFGADAEAVRLVQSMPRWHPGRQANQPVHVRYNLPIAFRLPDQGTAVVNGNITR